MTADPAALNAAMKEIENDAAPDAASQAAAGKKTTRKKTTRKKTTARKTTARKEASPKPVGRPGLDRRIEEHITGIGTLVFVFDETCGTAILDGSERLAKALKHLADENPRVKKTLESFLQTSAWGEVVMATGAIALPIMAHHNVQVIPTKLRRRSATTPAVVPDEPTSEAPMAS